MPTPTPAADDMSLQGWARTHLPAMAPALQEVADQHGKADAASVDAGQALTRLAQQAENDLPTSDRLTSDIQAAAAEWKRIHDEAAALAARRAAVIAQAEGLKALYDREHDADEERAINPRKSPGIESRADAGRAQQDI